MPKSISVADVKRDFSAVLHDVSSGHEHFVINKKGRPMAAMVSVEDLNMIEAQQRGVKGKGLLAAIGAWEDFDDFDAIAGSLRDARQKANDKDAEGLE
jgi:prevent-host-death family protein